MPSFIVRRIGKFEPELETTNEALMRTIQATNRNIETLKRLLYGHLDWANLGDLESTDEWGLNPDYIKRFPNKIVNSGFEWYDRGTMEPRYWDGNGRVTPNANWEGDVALRLEPGEYIYQGYLWGTVPAGADPEWWGHEQTRVSFKHKGGAVAVSVGRYDTGDTYPLVDNSDTENPVYSEISGSNHYLVYPEAENWEDGYRSFYFSPTVGGGRVWIDFENVDSSENAYVDAVQIEPDFTEKWPSFYTRGPRSLPASEIGTGAHSTVVVASSDSLNPERADVTVPSGVTNAQEYINAAIEMLPDVGGRVFLLEGTYIIDDTIILSKDRITIEGQGWNSIVKLKDNMPVISTHFHMFNNDPTSFSFTDPYDKNFTFRNFTIDGNHPNNNPYDVDRKRTGAQTTGIWVRGVEEIVIDHMKFFEINGLACARFEECLDVNVSNSHFINPGYMGLDVTYWDGREVYSKPPTSVRISGCLFDNYENGCIRNGRYGYIRTLTAWVESHQTLITGNMVKDTLTDVTLKNGIWAVNAPMIGSDGGINISDNTIMFDAPYYAVEVYNYYEISDAYDYPPAVVANNTLFNGGIYLHTSATGPTIVTGNSIKMDSGGATDGIYCDVDDPMIFRIDNNVISGARRGITTWIDHTPSSGSADFVGPYSISGNTIEDVAQGGIYCWPASCNDGSVANWRENMTISNNTVRNAGHDGIYLTSIVDSLVTGNVVSGSNQEAGGYSNIVIDADSLGYHVTTRPERPPLKDNLISNNVCRVGSGGAEYGIVIRVTASHVCDKNLVINNDLMDSGTLGDILDGGTDTSFGPGNRKQDGSWGTPV